MKNKKIALAGICLLGAMFLMGCKDQKTTMPEPPTEQRDTRVTIYETMMKDGREQYKKGELDAAAGTLKMLLQNDLSEFEALKKEAEELLNEVNLAQSKDEKNEMLTKVVHESDYKTERFSSLAAEEFAEDTGGDIVTATDKEIEGWLLEKKTDESRRVSSKDSGEEKYDAAEEEMEEQEQVLLEITEQINIQPEGYEFFIIKTDDHFYQVEIRQANEMDGIAISNMIGIFQYNFESKLLEKLNPITGEYELYTNEKA